jgi:hypothetical protein
VIVTWRSAVTTTGTTMSSPVASANRMPLASDTSPDANASQVTASAR